MDVGQGFVKILNVETNFAAVIVRIGNLGDRLIVDPKNETLTLGIDAERVKLV